MTFKERFVRIIKAYDSIQEQEDSINKVISVETESYEKGVLEFIDVKMYYGMWVLTFEVDYSREVK